MITVVLADDHHLVRQGIRSLLEKAGDIEIVGEAEDGQQAVELVERLSPDVLVIDIAMPHVNGIQATKQIQTLRVKSRVVILSIHSDGTLVRQALQNGARGYLLKRSVTEELLLAIRAAHRGEVYLCPAISELVMDGFLASRAGSDEAGPLDQLSPREGEVFQLLVEGHSVKEIAEVMHITVKTVRKHRSNILSKLDVEDLAGLVRIAIKHRLIFVNE